MSDTPLERFVAAFERSSFADDPYEHPYWGEPIADQFESERSRKMSADREEHTPGPWEYDPATIQRRHEVVVPRTQDIKGRLRKVADVNREADARLIAAAPEQNEALSLLVRTILDAERHGWSEAECEAILQVVREQAQPALTKARGEN